MGDLEETASPAPLQHREDGIVLLVDSDELAEAEAHSLTRLPSEEALVAALRGHKCWVCGASAATHDANLDHLMAHLQAAPAVPDTPLDMTQSSDEGLEDGDGIEIEASAVDSTAGESPMGHGDPKDDPTLTDPTSTSPDDPPVLAAVVLDNVPVNVSAGDPSSVPATTPVTATDVPVNVPDSITDIVPESAPESVPHKVQDTVQIQDNIEVLDNAQDLSEGTIEMDTATPEDAIESPALLSPSSDPATLLPASEAPSPLVTEAAVLLDSEDSFPPSPEGAEDAEDALQPVDPDVVLQPSGPTAPFGAPPPSAARLSDSDIRSVLLCAADELAMESASLFADEDLTPTAMVPGLRALDSALEGLAADVAAAAAASAEPAPSPPPPSPCGATQPHVPEVTFFKEPPRYSYAGKSSARQRPSLDLIVSRLFSQRAAIEAANKTASRAETSTLLDENSNLQDAIQHNFREVVQDKHVASPGASPDTAGDGGPDLADLYALTAAALDAQLPNSLVCAICLMSFEDRDGLLRHVEDEVRALSRQAKTPKQRLRPRPPRKNVPPEAPAPAPARTRPVRAVTKKAIIAKVEPPPPPPATKWTCVHCRGDFPRRTELRAHVAAEHKDAAERPHQCPVCQKRFGRRAHLEQHQLLHTDERPFQCGHCGMSFRRKDRLVVHVRTHTPRGAESRSRDASKDTAKVATKVTRNTAKNAASSKPAETVPKSLEAAKRAASPAADAEESLTCMTCSKTFPIKSRLRRHVLSAHAAMPHVCLTCGKNCLTKKRLHAHVVRHIADRVRIFRCNDCGDVLDDKRSLLRHRWSRHGDKVRDAADDKPAQNSSSQLVVPTGAPSSASSSRAPSSASCSTSSSGTPSFGTSSFGAPSASTSSSSTSSSSALYSGERRPNVPAKDSGTVSTVSKSPQKFVFKIVSKKGSSQTANMAAQLLPTLASDFASKRSGPKSPSKVVYMVMSKNSKAGISAAGSKPGDKLGSKVLLKFSKKVPCLVPRTPPKLGFKVVSKVVPLDHPPLKEETRPSPAYQDAINSAAVNPVHRPATPPAWPTPALRSLPGVTPLYGAPYLGALPMGVPSMSVPSMSVPSMSVPSMSVPSMSVPSMSVPSMSVPSMSVPCTNVTSMADPMGVPYVDALYMDTPCLDASPLSAPSLGAPFLSPPCLGTPYLGAPYLGAPSLDASSMEAPSPDPPVLEVVPQDDPTQGVPQGPWTQGSGSKLKQVGQFPAATDGRYLCDTCGRRFMSESLYILHMQAHGKAVKTFECQCCGQRFLDKEVLRAHWQTHM